MSSEFISPTHARNFQVRLNRFMIVTLPNKEKKKMIQFLSTIELIAFI